MGLTRMLDHTHVRTNLGNPGHECTQCGNGQQPEPSYYPPISEHPQFTVNDRLHWQIDKYRRSSSFARFLDRWQAEGVPRYVYTRPLTMAELKLDLQYLSDVLRTFVESKAERYEFRPSQMGCEAFLREWRGPANAEGETQHTGPNQPSHSQPSQQPQQKARRRRFSLNAYTAFRGEFIPGARSWSPNHRSRREAARARYEFFEQQRPPGTRANTSQQRRNRRPQRFGPRSQHSRRHEANPEGYVPLPFTRRYSFFRGDATRAPQLVRHPTPSESPAQDQFRLQHEELARTFQNMNLAGYEETARPPV